MKKTIALIIALVCIVFVFSAQAEDYSSMTLDELTEKRQELMDELTRVNALRGGMIRQQANDGVVADEAIGKIIEIFPDEELAITIRNSCGKISIEQSVTQEDLDRVEMLTCIYNDIHDFTGIRYLRNLWYFHTNDHYDGVFPDELRYCQSLKSLYITDNPNITVIPDWIDELINLETIDFSHDNITQLPDSICNLLKLESFDVSRNEGLSKLPVNIGNLTKLQRLVISRTAISELPDSTWNLSLSYFGAEGLPIK